MGIINPGDELIVADPHYAVYDQIVEMFGGKVIAVPVDKEAGFLLRPDLIEAAVTPRTKAILIINPDNPSGAIQPRAIIEAIAGIAQRHDVLIVADELYERFCFDGVTHTSIGSLPGMRERTITLNGFSKAYSMTGWRVGYLLVPPGMKPALTSIKHATSICAAAPSQIAALAVLTGPQEPLEEMMTEWSARRTYLYDRLAAADIPVIRTAGSYYTFIDISRAGLSSREFSHRLLAEECVRVGPGSSYGHGGEGHARVSFMLPIAELSEGLDRLERFWKRLTDRV
jgi:aminotransferase